MNHLNKSGTDYAITGALAASYYGRPRSTIDADFMVRVLPRELNSFLRGLERIQLDVDTGEIRRQIKAGYNIISAEDKLSPHTADLIIRKTRIQKRKGTLEGLETYYQTPESLIVAKLRMIKATRPVGRSEKDREDIRAILTNTRVNKRHIQQAARREATLDIFKGISGELL